MAHAGRPESCTLLTMKPVVAVHAAAHAELVAGLLLFVGFQTILAWGRDYGDVSPVRGVLFGGGPHDLSVMVDVVAT